MNHPHPKERMRNILAVTLGIIVLFSVAFVTQDTVEKQETAETPALIEFPSAPTGFESPFNPDDTTDTDTKATETETEKSDARTESAQTEAGKINNALNSWSFQIKKDEDGNIIEYIATKNTGKMNKYNTPITISKTYRSKEAMIKGLAKEIGLKSPGEEVYHDNDDLLFKGDSGSLFPIATDGNKIKITSTSVAPGSDDDYVYTLSRINGQPVYEERTYTADGEVSEETGKYQISNEGGTPTDNTNIAVDTIQLSILKNSVTSDPEADPIGKSSSGIHFTDKNGNPATLQKTQVGQDKSENNKLPNYLVKTEMELYYHKDGYPLTEKQYNKLNKAGDKNAIKANLIARESLIVGKDGKARQRHVVQPRQSGDQIWLEGDTYSYTEEGKVGQAVLTGISYTAKDKNGKQYTALYNFDRKTGELKLASGMNENGEEVNLPDDIKATALARAKQRNQRSLFEDFEFKLGQYKGLSGFSQFIIGKEEVAKWQNNIDDLFTKLYLKQDPWESLICKSYLPKKDSQVITLGTSNGLYDIAGGYPTGERTQAIQTPDGVERIYKLSYSFRNPKDAKLGNININIIVKGPNRQVQLYRTPVPIEPGQQFIRGFLPDQEAADPNLQRPPVIATSPHEYTEICMTFSPSIENAEGDKESEICNLITEYRGPPTKVANPFGTVGSDGFPAAEPDFNEATI